MRSIWRWALLVPVLVATCASYPAAPAPSERERIGRWIEQLGDNDFARREDASQRLWEAGELAEPALREAAKSPDAEVARRANDVLERFRWGIYPSTPKDVVELIHRYQNSDRGPAGAVAIRDLFEHGAHGCKAVLKIARAETDAGIRRRLFSQIANEMPRAIPVLLAENAIDTLRTLVEVGLEQDVKTGASNYVAFWVLRGQLEERVKQFESDVKQQPNDKKAWELLAYLRRAQGANAAARAAAEQSGRADLVDALLYEAGKWKELAARPVGTETTHEVEKLGLLAAYQRLAGQVEESKKSLADLIELANKDTMDEAIAGMVGKALFLNDQPADGLKVWRQSGLKVEAYKVLVAQLRMSEAFQLIEEERKAKGPQLAELELYSAQFLNELGEKQKALAIVTRYGEQIKDKESAWYETLLEVEVRMKLRDQAIAHGAKMLADAPELQRQQRLLRKLFPAKSEDAAVWWQVLRGRDSKLDIGMVLKQLDDILEGKSKEDVSKLIADATLASEKVEGNAVASEHWIVAIADAALAAGNERLARRVLQGTEKTASQARSVALTKLGDLCGDKKEWSAAASAYQKAWETDKQKPLPLFLCGNALVQMGQRKEGEQRMEQAHWLPLGNEYARYLFLNDLANRDFKKACQRETELLLSISQPAGFYAGEALRRRSLSAVGHKDYLRAAEEQTKSMLRCLRVYVSFSEPASYAMVPALVHRLRARGLLAAGKIDDALREAGRCQELVPGNIDVTLQMTPQLDQLGRKADADAIYNLSRNLLENLVKEYPASAWLHNSLAWQSACCRRELDAGLAHAVKATTLAPTAAGYFDTLAEVRFQRGEQALALAAQRKAVELDTKRVYYAKQLKRIEAGDPKAARPPEFDDGEDDD